MPRGPQGAAGRARSWCFTLNNPDEPYPEFDDTWMKYLVYQLEEGEEGTPHLQGYVQCSNARKLHLMKEWLPTAHFEIARGSPAQNVAYCTKLASRQGGPWVYGEEPAQGKRSDWVGMRDAIKEWVEAGLTDAQILDHVVLGPWVHLSVHERQLVKIAGVFRRASNCFPERSVPQLHCYWGETGTGKTRRCWEEAGAGAYAKPAGKWFEGYSGQENVILDEFPDDSIGITLLLQMLDRYPLTVEVKGGSVSWTPSKIWISSNLRPEDWYPSASPEHRAALMRRLTEFGVVEHMGEGAGGGYANPYD